MISSNGRKFDVKGLIPSTLSPNEAAEIRLRQELLHVSFGSVLPFTRSDTFTPQTIVLTLRNHLRCTNLASTLILISCSFLTKSNFRG